MPIEGQDATANNAFMYRPPGWGYLAIVSGKRRISMILYFMLTPGYRTMAMHIAITVALLLASLPSCFFLRVISAILYHGDGVLLDSQNHVYHLARIAFRPHQWISLAYEAMALNPTIHALNLTHALCRRHHKLSPTRHPH